MGNSNVVPAVRPLRSATSDLDLPEQRQYLCSLSLLNKVVIDPNSGERDSI